MTSSESKVEFVFTESETTNTAQRLSCNVRIENPQFILYENQFEPQKSNTLIIDGLILFKVDLISKRTKIVTSFNDFMVQMRSVKAKRVLRRNKYIILQPTSIQLTGEIIDYQKSSAFSVDDLEATNKQNFILDLQDINLNLSPQMLNTSLKMANSIH